MLDAHRRVVSGASGIQIKAQSRSLAFAQDRLRAIQRATMKQSPEVHMLPPRAQTIPGIGGFWCGVKCRPRSEKDFAADLMRAGFDFFVPLVNREDNWGRVVQVPPLWLTGMLFASSPDAPYPGFQVPTALHYFLQEHRAFYRMLPVAAAAQERFQIELQHIHAEIVQNNHSDYSIKTPMVGQMMQVTEGNFQGQRVTVERIVSPTRVVVGVTTLGDIRPTEIDVRHLEPAY